MSTIKLKYTTLYVKTTAMKPEAASSPSHNTPQRAVIQFLLDNRGGATMNEILRHLKERNGLDSEGQSQAVESLLENGISMGFLERRGSYYQNWQPKESKCSKKRRSRKRSCCRRCCPKRRRRRRHRRAGRCG